MRPARLVLIEAEGWAHVEPATGTAFERLLNRLRDCGVEIVGRRENALVEAFEQAIADSLALCRDICGYELRWTLQNLIEQHGAGLSASLMTRYELSRSMTLADYRAVLLRREQARQALAAVAAAGDAMICLSSVGPAPLLDNAGIDSGIEHTTGLPAFNGWTSVTGAPAVTLPLLAVDGLPVGVQVVGQLHSDHRIAGIGRWIAEAMQRTPN